MKMWMKVAATFVLVLLIPMYVVVVTSLPMTVESTCANDQSPGELASTLQDRGNEPHPAGTRQEILESHNSVHEKYLNAGSSDWEKGELQMEHTRLELLLEEEGVNHTELHQMLNERDQRYPLELAAGGGDESAGFCTEIGMQVVRSYYFGAVRLPVYNAGVNMDWANRLFVPVVAVMIASVWFI